MIGIKKYIFLLTALFIISCSSDESSNNGVSSEDDNRPLNSSIDYYINTETINQLIDEINNDTYGEVHSLLIMRDDTLLVEKYFRDYNSDELHVCYSVTKSFTSALIGIAVDKGFISGTDAKLTDFLSEVAITNNTNNWKDDITLEHVLTMSAGFTWNEWAYNYNDSRNIVSNLVNSSDWMEFMLNLPMSYQPGQVFTYNSGCTMLLSGVILSSTGLRTSDFAVQNLFEPLDINDWEWEQGPNRITNTGWGLRMRSRDLLKLGKLFLQKGVWEGNRIISEEWINASTKYHIDINQSSQYAFQWWRYSDNSSTAQVLQTNDVYYADGWGNQYIWVIPHLNMVVVSNAGNFSNGTDSNSMFRDYILPAAYNADR